MTASLSNLIHKNNNKIEASRAAAWMRQNWREHLAGFGQIDTEAMAEQAAWEFGISREQAAELAAELAKETKDGE